MRTTASTAWPGATSVVDSHSLRVMPCPEAVAVGGPSGSNGTLGPGGGSVGHGNGAVLDAGDAGAIDGDWPNVLEPMASERDVTSAGASSAMWRARDIRDHL